MSSGCRVKCISFFLFFIFLVEMKFIFKMNSFTLKKKFTNICPVYQFISEPLKQGGIQLEKIRICYIIPALMIWMNTSCYFSFQVQRFASFKKDFNLWLFLSGRIISCVYFLCLICLMLICSHLAHLILINIEIL